MIRGKAVEEAIRFAFFDHRDKLSVPAAQNYANDLYYLRTKHFPHKVIKSNAKPINILSVDAVLIFESTFKIKWKPKLDMVCE